MLNITAIPAFADNYIWCLHDEHTAVAVDPGDAAPVLSFLREHNLDLKALLITHHHPDHVGGIADLRRVYPELKVFGPDNPRIDGITQQVREGDHIDDLLGLDFAVWAVPGHTLDHLAFVSTSGIASKEEADKDSSTLLFCGDTLFSAGCGRLFEGSPEQMLASLTRLAALPDGTRVYCTHEYTLSNLRFAHAVEPDNAEIAQRLATVTQMRAANISTLPTNLALERSTNPFLRSDIAAVQRAARTRGAEKLETALDVFTAIRRWKDQF